MKKFENQWLQLGLLILLVAGIGAYFYFDTRESVKVITIVPSKTTADTTVAKKDKPRVVLKAFVTACQKLTVTIPLDAGVITQSDDLRVMRGYVENHGNVPVQFVKLQVVWRDGKGKGLEYEEIYAVRTQPLMPGEKASFQSSKRNMLIEKCNVRVQDWWVVTEETAKSGERPSDAPKEQSHRPADG
ncbi:MAG: hypothetical protein ABGY96_15660 [bacterium]|nr:hypothetical protein [Gammaproteobacteria bacterium]HIL98914.1 hypothetical protein [Pseudomonadales bacterium]